MSKESTQHWMKQRATGFAIFSYALICVACIYYYKFYFDKICPICKRDPIPDSHIIILFLVINLICIYHGALGMRVIIEDYIKRPKIVKITIFLINLISVLSSIATITSLILLSEALYSMIIPVYAIFLSIVTSIIVLRFVKKIKDFETRLKWLPLLITYDIIFWVGFIYITGI